MFRRFIVVASLLSFFFAYCSCGKNGGDSITKPTEPPVEVKPYIQWDQATRRQIAFPAATENVYYSYPRIIELANGNLAAIFEHNFGTYFSKSVDGGNTWSAQQLIVAPQNNIYAMAPEIMQATSGVLIAAYNLRPQPMATGAYDPAKKFAIAIKRSTDGGQTWGAEKILYQAGHEFKNGCWEPSMVQLPSGEIQLFFSDEGVYTSSNEQNISIIKSNDDGVTWTTSPQIASFSRNYRDGMPSPVYEAKNSRILFSIEDNSAGAEFKPSIISLPQPWSGQAVDAVSSNRNRLLINELAKTVYAGAPYLRIFPNGTYAVSMQSTLNRGNDWNLSDMQVAIGTSFDKMYLTFKPFQVPLNKSALWNSICILKDGTIIAVASTNAYANYSGIWIIKGQLKTS